MKRRASTLMLASVLACLAGLAAFPARADQSPSPGTLAGADSAPWSPAEPWSQLQGGPEHLGSVPDAPAPPYEIAWRYQPKDLGGFSTAVVAGDTAYAISPKHVAAVDVASGTERWVVDRVEAPVTPPAAVTSKAGSLLLYTEGKGKDTTLVGIDGESKERVLEVPLEDDSHSGVTVAGGTAYVGNDSGKVFAVDVARGKTEWTSDSPSGKILAPITVADGRAIYPASDSAKRVLRFVALDAASGERDWNIDSGFASATAFSASGDALYTGTLGFSGGEVAAVDAASGAAGWKSRLRNPVSQNGALAVSGDRIFAVDQAVGIYAIDLKSGERSWDFQVNGTAQGLGAPLVVAGGRYVLTGLQDGSAVAVDTSSGHLVWRADAAGVALKAPAIAGDLIVFGLGGSDGGMVALRHVEGSLSDEVSPTVLNPSKVATAFAIGLVAIPLILFLVGRLVDPWLWKRGVESGQNEGTDQDGETGEPDDPDETEGT